MSRPKNSHNAGNPTKPGQVSSTLKRDRGEDPAAEYKRKRQVLRLGQCLMAVGAVIAVVHLLTHLGAFGSQPSGWQDLAVGYPTAGLVFLAGAIAAGQ